MPKTIPNPPNPPLLKGGEGGFMIFISHGRPNRPWGIYLIFGACPAPNMVQGLEFGAYSLIVSTHLSQMV